LAGAVALSFALVSCHSDPDDARAQEALDSVTSAHAEAALLAAATSHSLGLELTATEAAEEAVEHIPDMMGGNCVKGARSDATARFEFNDCTGPSGLEHLSGVVTVTFAFATDGLHARAKAIDLRSGGVPITLDAEGVTRAQGSTHRLLEVTTNGAGMGSLGDRFVRKGSYEVTLRDDGWSPMGCITLDGSWSTRLIARDAKTTVSDYTRCGRSCPDAGARIEHAVGDGATIEIAFDGGRTAHWTSSHGRSGELELNCESE
jgi:hypothetical protein